jgi:hypothetical protein
MFVTDLETISGFRREVDENCAILANYSASSGKGKGTP